jgi:hypothetical protein
MSERISVGLIGQSGGAERLCPTDVQRLWPVLTKHILGASGQLLSSPLLDAENQVCDRVRKRRIAKFQRDLCKQVKGLGLCATCEAATRIETYPREEMRSRIRVLLRSILQS